MQLADIIEDVKAAKAAAVADVARVKGFAARLRLYLATNLHPLIVGAVIGVAAVEIVKVL